MNSVHIDGPQISQLIVRDARSFEGPEPITYARLGEILSGGPVLPNMSMSPRKAMQLTAVWACVERISNDLAKLPLLMYERTEKGRRRATDHPYYPLLKLRPSPLTSAFSLVKTLIVNRMMHGRGHAEIVRRGDGLIQAIVPVETPRVQPFVRDGLMRYQVQTDRGQITMQARDMLHIPGLSFDGYTDLSVISHARMTFAGAYAGDETAARLQAQGLRTGGVLEHPGKVPEPDQERIRTSLEAMYGGPNGIGRAMILEQGMKWNAAMSITPSDAQFLESRKFSRSDIAVLFGVDPAMMGWEPSGTGTSIEQKGLQYLSMTISPIITAVQQELNYKLFGTDEAYYAAFLIQALVQVDMATRGKWYETMQRIGGLNVDEIRDREDLNALDDERGAVHYVPSSLMPAITPDQADRLAEAWITSRGRTGGNGGGDPDGGAPKPETDGKVGGDPTSV